MPGCSGGSSRCPCGGIISYLTATPGAVGPNPSGGAPVDLPLTLYDSAGADLSINGADPTRVDVATTGKYLVGLSGTSIGINPATVTFVTGYAAWRSGPPAGPQQGTTSFTHNVQEFLNNGIFAAFGLWMGTVFAGQQIWIELAVQTDDGSTWGSGGGANEGVEVLRVR